MIEPNEATREVSTSSRRSFLKRSAVGAGAVWTASLQSFMVRRAEAAPCGSFSANHLICSA